LKGDPTVKPLLAILTLLAGPAAAHDLGGPHVHPHLDPGLLALIALTVGAAAGVAILRGRR
jgi:hypothetical protein